jgi:protein-tyrosine phosphatase
VIDLHCHILPGVDDGPATFAEAIELARAAVDDGVELIAATPHVRDDYPTTADEMERQVERLRAVLAEHDVDVDVRAGGEIALDMLPTLDLATLRRYGLAGNPRYVLIETPYFGFPLDFGERIFRLQAEGITPVLAHPERNSEIQTSPRRLEPFVETGMLVQLTTASVSGRLGRSSKKASFDLLDAGLAHMIGSDAHAASGGRIGIKAAGEAVGNAALFRWLAVDVPSAIVEDTAIPERPARRRRIPWFSKHHLFCFHKPVEN